MFLVLLLLYLHLGSHSFYLLFMFLLLPILFWCQALEMIFAQIHLIFFFPVMFFLPWGHLEENQSIDFLQIT